jgi:hypothetical protein
MGRTTRVRGGGLRLVALAAAVVVASTGCWFQFGFDAGHSGYNSSESTLGPANVATIALTGSFPFPSSAPPSLDGSAVYDPTTSGPPPGPALSKLDRITNALIWTVPLAGVPTTPAVGNSNDGGDGMVFVTFPTPNGAVLQARDAASGAPVWSVGLPGMTPTSATLAKSTDAAAPIGVLYVTMQDTHTVVSYTTAGALLATSAPALYYTPVSVGTMFGLAYVGQTNGTLVALRLPALTVAWISPVSPAPVVVSPALFKSHVVAVALNATVGTFDATTGVPIWTAAPGGFVLNAPADGQGEVLVTIDQGGFNKVFALNDATGVVDWTHVPTVAAAGSGPSLANGVVYYFDGTKTEALDVTTGGPLATEPGGVAYQAPAIAQAHLYTPGANLNTFG